MWHSKVVHFPVALIAFLSALALGGARAGAGVPADGLRGLEFSRGISRGASYAVVRVNPRFRELDIVTFGRRGPRWTAHALPMSAVSSECVAVMNGTFYSVRFHEPLGVLVYDRGTKEWTPHAQRWDRPVGRWVQRPVSHLPRWYLVVFSDGHAAIGNSCGLSATTLRTLLELLYWRRVRCLMGGCGLLVSEGRGALSPRTLADAGFDGRSGLHENDACPRSAIGITAAGEILMVTCGLEGAGISLKQLSDLMVDLGAQQAVFLDCGGSTAMRWDRRWSRSSGRPLPTWWVVR